MICYNVYVAVYSSINETMDPSQLVEDGYYATPKTASKVCTYVCNSTVHIVL